MSLARNFNTRPLYQQVADEFAARLIRGEWAPGQTIANEADIARNLGISLGTVRKAFDILVEHDLLERHQGRGTVVPDTMSGERRHRFSNVFVHGGQRISGELHIDAVKLAVPDDEVASKLEVNERTPVLSFRRTRRYGSRVFMLEQVFLRVDANVREADEATLRRTAITRWSGYDIATSKGETVFTTPATQDDARLFSVAEGAPILLLERIIRSYQRKPLEFRIGRCNLGNDLLYCAK